MQNIVYYVAQENLFKYERDEINLLLDIRGGEIKLINPDQFMEEDVDLTEDLKNGMDVVSSVLSEIISRIL